MAYIVLPKEKLYSKTHTHLKHWAYYDNTSGWLKTETNCILTDQ